MATPCRSGRQNGWAHSLLDILGRQADIAGQMVVQLTEVASLSAPVIPAS